MIKIIRSVNFIFILLFTISCDSVFFKRHEFENEFKNHIANSDSVLYDGDFLHPTYAFIKNGKIKGIEFNANPECGKYIGRYFLDEDEKISKIILDKNFFSDHCGKPFDSIFVIDLPSKQIKTYTRSTGEKKINDEKLVENAIIDIDDYREKIKKWRYREH